MFDTRVGNTKAPLVAFQSVAGIGLAGCSSPLKLYEVPSSDSWATQALLLIFWSFKLLGRVQPRSPTF